MDPAGDIRLVEFFANGEFIGRSQYLLKIAVIPGKPIPHRLVWEGVPAGPYQVIARAVDTAGNPVASTPLDRAWTRFPRWDGRWYPRRQSGAT